MSTPDTTFRPEQPPPITVPGEIPVRNNNEDDIARRKTIEENAPTESHTLAQIEYNEKGLVQKASDTDGITDVGWGLAPEDIEEPLIGGLSNEELWMLIRRFNKQMYYVKAAPHPPLDNLDLNVVENKEFSPDRLRSDIERFYMTVIVGLTSFWKHIARLRSWREPRRTAVFCMVYFLAWILDLIVPTFLTTLIVLIVHPPSRELLFPPAPIALVSSETGGVQRPRAGVLGSHDSITGAPERHQGEAAEQEASNLVASVASVAVGSAAGKHDQGVPENAPIEGSIPDPMEITSTTADAQAAAHGKVPSPQHDKSKQPMREAVWTQTRRAMHVISDVTDMYERFGNALSPTPPFPEDRPRLRLASVLVLALWASLLTSAYVFVKTSAFLAGLCFFGDPIIRYIGGLLNHHFPHWQKLLELRNSLLKDIPTNAQLTITLLRIGEASGAPLPPPPSSALHRAPSRPASLRKEDLPLDASNREIEQAVKPDPHQTDTAKHDVQEPKNKSKISSLIHFLKGTTATGVETKLAVDRVKAVAGSRHAKNNIGILHRKGRIVSPSGPVEFEARYRGKKGAMVLDSSTEPATLYFTKDLEQVTELQEHQMKDGNDKEHKHSINIMFSIPVTSIQELKKVGGMGWKGKLIVGWSEAHKEVVDGLVITIGKEDDPTRQQQKSYHVTAMKARDELFNRLVAMGGQVWESY
ncbi:hypothetical protein VTN00DRAFT_8332 [Thermoascus crustaceus]|uniref:uncharacterized protein n=1 Tax=Thermoascus crustaceus TaxID=5088 RepID=UPI003742026A